MYKRQESSKNFECAIYGVLIPTDPGVEEIAKRLRKHPYLRYVEVERDNYTPAIDEKVCTILKETDIFVQPYRTLESTVDTPLLLLEAMASLCAVMTRPVGDVERIYGESPFLIRGDSFVDSAMELLEGLEPGKMREKVLEERVRLYERVHSLGCNVEEVIERFLRSLDTDTI